MSNVILSFPGLGIGDFVVNPVAFFSVHWYGIIITTGMVIAFFYALYRARQIGITVDTMLDIAIFLIPCAVLGARLYYVLTTPGEYDSFLDVIAIWNGGLAIYGGVIAGVITVFAVCRYKKLKTLDVLDCIAPGLILAQAIGRWGNFCNGEAFGYETDIFCRMSLNNSSTLFQTLMVHPCFLYESLWNILGFILINIFYKKRKYDGQVFIAVCGWYGLGRAWIEGLRTDSLYLPEIFGLSLRVSQVLALAVAALCVGLLIYHAVKKTNKPLYIKT